MVNRFIPIALPSGRKKERKEEKSVGVNGAAAAEDSSPKVPDPQLL